MPSTSGIAEQFKWPPKSVLAVYTGVKGRPLARSTDRTLDLSDLLMTSSERRRVIFGLSTTSRTWWDWNEARLDKIERLIRYQFEFEGFSVKITRLSGYINSCEYEYRWRLSVSPI